MNPAAQKGLSRWSPATRAAEAYFERHLVLDHIVDEGHASLREKFEAVALALRDLLAERWLKTQQAHDAKNPKQVYYISMEFLIGRSLTNNLTNLMVEREIRETLEQHGLRWMDLVEMEPDAGLGNGGLGRLAACFIDSLATLQIPAMGYGLRYEYGTFHQKVQNGYQLEEPDNWLRDPDPWEVVHPKETTKIRLNASVQHQNGILKPVPGQPRDLLGVPYDRPVVGYGGNTINTLRLWGAAAPEYFDLTDFSHGDFLGAVLDRVVAEALTRVLYPDDSTPTGRTLRFAQEYFLVACSLADIISRFRRRNNDWQSLPDKVAVQMNDTHPALAVAELMRILVDEAGLGWDNAWDLTRRTLAYTNHTLLPEALEKWPVRFFDVWAPRHLEIICYINARFLAEVVSRFPGDDGRVQRMSLIEERPARKVRMAHLAVIGSNSTNGVARIHSSLLRTRVMADFAEMYPERFNNKTNGVSPRRWLLQANPGLAKLITEALGDGWMADLGRLRELIPLAADSAFAEDFRGAKHQAKLRFIDWLKTSTGETVDPETIFDTQIKRIHEYKRQLLNVLHIIVLYNRLRENPGLDVPPRTFFLAGKAAPAYTLAKLIIKLINSVAAAVNADPVCQNRLKVVFLPDYCVGIAERLIPASDISEQISTAGYEASGTGNMKLMMNGALTVGTRDGATIEMAEEAGEENFFLFGLTAEEVLNNRGWYSPRWHYENDRETRLALDLIASDHFSRDEQGIFTPISDKLIAQGDYYMHLADLPSYANAQADAGALYRNRKAWASKAILNVAYSGRFSSDRSIMEYASDIWRVNSCPVE